MPTTIQISAIEVNQAIQHLDDNNSVPLIHGKKTFIRLYCTVKPDTKNPPAETRWGANLVCNYTDSAGRSRELVLPCMQTVSLASIAVNRADARAQWDATLSFALHESNFFEATGKQFKTSAETVSLSFGELKTTYPAGSKALVVNKLKKKTVKFDAPLEFYCRAISYSYQDPETGDIAEPTSAQLHVIRDYIESAFPVSKVNWSTNAIEAPRAFTQVRQAINENKAAEEKIDLLYQLLFQHLLAIRAQETSLKDKDRIDPRTIYIGVLSDPTDRFGGGSMDSPDYPTPHIVAFADSQSDGALAAHEISHLLGMLHPGIPDKKIHGSLLGQTNQIELDPNNIGLSDIGQIDIPDALTTEDRLIGLQALPGSRTPELLDSRHYFDLNTYRTPSWVSQHTYTHLYSRLRSIDELDFSQTESEYINLIGSYNLINKTASVQFAIESDTPQDFIATKNLSSETAIDAKDIISPLAIQEPDKSAPTPIYIRRNPDRTDTNFSLGVFQFAIKKEAALRDSTFNLQLNGNVTDVLDFYSPGNLAKQRLLDEPVVRTNKAMKDKVSAATFSGVDHFIKNAEKKAALHKETDPQGIFKFQFHVRESCLYINYNWVKRLFAKGSTDAAKKQAIDTLLTTVDKKNLPIDVALQLLHYTQSPITTIVELKYPAPAQPKRPDDHIAEPDEMEDIDRWETIHVSNRLTNTKVWVPHRYVIQSLNTYARGGSGFPNFETRLNKPDDKAHKTAIFNIQCRITLVTAGHTIKLYETPVSSSTDKSCNQTIVTPKPTYAEVIGMTSGVRKNDGQAKTTQLPGSYDSAVDFKPATAVASGK